jgi:hypothetical protein
MRTKGRDFGRIILFAAVAIGYGFAQKLAPEKHVKDIKAEQTQDVISASALCQQVRADGHSYIHRPEVNPSTLSADLFALMQQSDEVILASTFRDQTEALGGRGHRVFRREGVAHLEGLA